MQRCLPPLLWLHPVGLSKSRCSPLPCEGSYDLEPPTWRPPLRSCPFSHNDLSRRPFLFRSPHVTQLLHPRPPDMNDHRDNFCSESSAVRLNINDRDHPDPYGSFLSLHLPHLNLTARDYGHRLGRCPWSAVTQRHDGPSWPFHRLSQPCSL